MPYFSHSRLASYETCPLQYKLRYLDQVAVPRRESVESFLGRRVHEVLERLYQRVEEGAKPTLDEIVNHFHESWAREWGDAVHLVRDSETPAGYQLIGERCLLLYYRRHDPFDRGRTIGSEMLLTYVLEPERELELQGYADRLVDLGDGNLEIHDYKTSRRLPSQEEVDQDRQLGIYQLAVSERFPERPVRLVWHYLAHDRMLSSTRTPESLIALKAAILSRIDEIEAATQEGHFPARSSPLCHWCEYKPYCPVWNPEAALPLAASAG